MSEAEGSNSSKQDGHSQGTTKAAKEGSQLITNGQDYETGKPPYPKSVVFIIGTEFCERFSYYGMRAILILYLTTWLGFDNSTATSIFHAFVVLCYFSPVLGAVVADGYLGRYRTILYLSLVYALGNILMTFTAFPPPSCIGPMFAMILIGVGTGGIKPCVSAFGGDQFTSQQEKERLHFFSAFYFAINLGSFLTMIITPIVREYVECFGSSCFPVAFALPAVLMLTAIVLFVIGRRYYKIYPATGSVIREMICSIGRALKNRCGSCEKKDHWMYYADDKYDMTFLDSVRQVLHVFWLFIPLPVFWALYDQQGSRWTLQSAQLNLRLFGDVYILPDQIQAVNPVLILAFIPLFDYVIYPLLDKCKIPNSAIQRMVAGMTLAAVSFVISGVLQLSIDKSVEDVQLDVGLSRLHVINHSPCDLVLGEPFSDEHVTPTLTSRVLVLDSGTYNMVAEVRCPGVVQTESLPVHVKLMSQKAHFIFVAGQTPRAKLFEYELKKLLTGASLVSFLYMDHSPEVAGATVKVKVQNGDAGQSVDLTHWDQSKPIDIYPGRYDVRLLRNNSHWLMNTGATKSVAVGNAAVMTVLIDTNSSSFELTVYTNVRPSEISVWYQFPQYIVITAGEVLFSVTGLSFAYTQAPESMKSVVQAAWLLTTALGDVIVVIVAGVKLFTQAVEFFFFAVLMFLTTIVFAVMSLFYRYANHSGISQHQFTDGDNLHLTSTSEATLSDNQKDR